jgi:hypothetical protein
LGSAGLAFFQTRGFFAGLGGLFADWKPQVGKTPALRYEPVAYNTLGPGNSEEHPCEHSLL